MESGPSATDVLTQTAKYIEDTHQVVYNLTSIKLMIRKWIEQVAQFNLDPNNKSMQLMLSLSRFSTVYGKSLSAGEFGHALKAAELIAKYQGLEPKAVEQKLAGRTGRALNATAAVQVNVNGTGVSVSSSSPEGMSDEELAAVLNHNPEPRRLVDQPVTIIPGKIISHDEVVELLARQNSAAEEDDE